MRTAFSTVEHNLHRTRKELLARYFSRQQVARQEGDIYRFCENMVEQMLAGTEPFDVKNVFDCLTGNIISKYAFGKSMDFGARGDFENNFASWTWSFFEIAYFMRHIPLLRQTVRITPFFAPLLGKNIRAVMEVISVTIPEHIDAAVKDPKNGGIFGDLMADGSFPREEKERFVGEGFNFLLAGTETTAVRHDLKDIEE